MILADMFTAAGIVTLFGSALAAPQLMPRYVYDPNITIRSGPFSFPLSNGFPNPSPAALHTIEQNAHGTLPNYSLPTTISPDSVPVFQLIAFNELFEVAFFADLIMNMTNGMEGYRIGDKGIECLDAFEHVLRSLHTILAQEQLHALGANAILHTAGHSPIAPCQYSFPTATFHEAITFAAGFTDVVLGTLQEAIYDVAVDGDAEFTTLIASVIGQEGEQEGFFRSTKSGYQDDPSALPFLTASSGIFAYSALNQLVVVPQSCPNATAMHLPVLPPLSVNKVGKAGGKTSYSIPASNSTLAHKLHLVYVNQQNLPIVVQLDDISYTNQSVTFNAYMPEGLSGLVITALTTHPGPFANASELAAAAAYGPGLIELH